MKKETSKSAKKEKKAVRKDLFEKLSGEIRSIIEKSGYDSKKASKETKKAANHLAKKLSQRPVTGAKVPVAQAKNTSVKETAAKETVKKQKIASEEL